jgi:glycosyltransferase involved in cell wall biosynthesis
MNDPHPTASIVIRSKNEEALLGETLTALYAQTLRDFEVILVDSGSSDRTLEIARQFPVKIIRIRPQDFSYGRALNIGCAAARGKFLVFLSAHAVPLTDEWLAKLLSHFREARVAGAWGAETTDPGTPPKAEVVHQDLAMFLENFYFGFCNFNAAIRREIWREFLFDETIPYAEDKEWGYRVLNAGHLLVYDGTAYVFHDHRDNAFGIWHRVHKAHIAYACFLDLPTAAVSSVLRSIYWEALSLCRGTEGWRKRLGAFRTHLPRSMARQIGRYTGLRKGRSMARLSLQGKMFFRVSAR